MYWNPFKTEREDGQCHAPLVLSFPNGFKAQNERQTNKNNDDSRPQESILFSALSGLKDGVRLRIPRQRCVLASLYCEISRKKLLLLVGERVSSLFKLV